MHAYGGHHGWRGLRRLGAIATVLARHGLGELAERLLPGKKERLESARELPIIRVSPRRLRLILAELGPSFIKLGQLLSTRADLLPPEYIRELSQLQDRVPPSPLADIKEVIERDLGRRLEEIFVEFQDECLAAASVAQVHHARLPSGDRVVVKVVRPGIERQIREDLRLMYALARRLERGLEVGKILGLTNVVREFERSIFRELDMLIEAGSIEKFSRNFRGMEEIYIPKVYWDYTNKSVLVMERIDGIKIDQVDELKAHGIDPQQVALIGLRSFSRQLLEFGFFHADPHPGNTIVMHDGRVSLVDFGIIGYLDEETMRQLASIFLGYAEHDYDMVIEALIDAGIVDEEAVDLREFREDLKDVSEAFYGRSLQSISVRDVYEQIIQLLLAHHIQLPRNLLLLLKTFVQTEALGKILGSEVSLLEFTRPYAKKLLEQGRETRKILRGLGRDSRNFARYARGMPKLLHDVLRHLAQGRQRLELWHEGLPGFDLKLEKGLNRLTVGLIISASLLAAALVLNSSQELVRLDLPFLGLQRISLTAVFGLVGYTVATILGIWLIISIYRSGKL